MEQNQLVKSEQMAFGDITNMAKAFAESGMFPDMKQAAQCIVKIQAGQEIGIPPFAAMTGIHIIKGRPTIGAGLIAARVKGSGKYDYKVIQQDEKACSLDFYQGKEKLGNSTFTIDEAKKAGTQNLDKFPKNMLFARAVSNGVKWFCPDVFAGPVYVPEEMEDVHAEVIATKINEAPADLPPINESDKEYRTATEDESKILRLIETATDPALLRTFSAVNAKAFKNLPELHEALKQKGMALKAEQSTNQQ